MFAFPDGCIVQQSRLFIYHIIEKNVSVILN